MVPIKMSSAPRLSVSMGPPGVQGPPQLGEIETRERTGPVEDLLTFPALLQRQFGAGALPRSTGWGATPMYVDVQLDCQAIAPSWPH